MIALGSDHEGYHLKEDIKKYLIELGLEVKDFGTTNEEFIDYNLIAKDVANSIQKNECDKGILVSKIGSEIAICANKFKGIRCAVCLEEFTAKNSKTNIDANIVGTGAAVNIIRNWIASDFSSSRHLDELNTLKEIEKENMK